MALSECSLPARALPPVLSLLLFGRARSIFTPALTSSLVRKGGGGKVPETKDACATVTFPPESGGNSLRSVRVRAEALRVSFRVCLQLDQGFFFFQLRVRCRISTILSQLLPNSTLSRDLFASCESHKKYGGYFLNYIPQVLVFQKPEVRLRPDRDLCGTTWRH